MNKKDWWKQLKFKHEVTNLGENKLLQEKRGKLDNELSKQNKFKMN